MSWLERSLRFAVPLLLASLAFAQPEAPPKDAPPGSICITPKGWCKAVQPGPPGAPCTCKSGREWVTGLLK